MISTSPSHPWAAAMFSATRRMPSCTLARVRSLIARIVPSISAALGDHVVGRAGGDPSDGDHRRVEHVDRAGDHRLQCRDDLARHRDRVERPVRFAGVAALAGDPDRPSCRPTPSPARRRLLTHPLGSAEVMCNANAASTGESVPSDMGRHVEQPFVEHELGAVMALLAGLEHEQHATGDVVAPLGQQLALRSTSIAVWVSWPQACMHPSTCDAKSSPVSSGISQRVHVAAQQHRRAGASPSRSGRDPARRLVQRDVERQAVERLEHACRG